MRIKIRIGPMSLENGVLGLPIDCCRDWDSSNSVEGQLIYAGRISNITFSPKHKDPKKNIAKAWQFTVNDSVQFNQLRMDGVHTYVEEEVSGEMLICDFNEIDGKYVVNVVDIDKKDETKATKKIKYLLKQGLREEVKSPSKAPQWNSPSEWISFAQIDSYREVQNCLYIWQGKKENTSTVYLYVGIVGDTKIEGKSKRNLTQRLKEESKKFKKENNVDIIQFRYCSINNAQGYSIPELLKTIEMAEITLITSLFRCENARDNIDAIFQNYEIVLLNKMTSYKYVK